MCTCVLVAKSERERERECVEGYIRGGGGLTRHSPLNIVVGEQLCMERRNQDGPAFNWFVESLMPKKRNNTVQVFVSVSVYFGPCQCPLNNARHTEITLINKHARQTRG